jgi:DNA-binding NarL/FixJ family response regulator
VNTSNADRPIRVAVVEEHEILRFGLVACLAEDRSMDVRVANSEGLANQDMDIAVVSSDAARRQCFTCPIVVCSDDPDGPHQVAAGNDVTGVLHRGSLTAAQLQATVHAAAAGLQVKPHFDNDRPGEALDARGLRLLELIAEGHSTREIADEMSYSERTIKKIILELGHRMEARNRAEMVAKAIRRGLI